MLLIYPARLPFLQMIMWYTSLIILVLFTVTNGENSGYSRHPLSRRAAKKDFKSVFQRYILGEDSVNRDEAQSRCRAQHAELATIQSLYDIKSIKTFLDREPNGNKFWVGGMYRCCDECSKQPFEAECWFWDTSQGRVDFNPDFIQFTEFTQKRTPNSTSSMILLKRNPLKVDFDSNNSIHVYVCDRTPTTPVDTKCTCA